jgi:hypothetical protein
VKLIHRLVDNLEDGRRLWLTTKKPLSGRARRLETVADISERKMFGGISFLLGGNMAVGVVGEELCVRVGPDAFEQALEPPGARIMDFTGRPMRGWVFVEPSGFADEKTLAAWVKRAPTPPEPCRPNRRTAACGNNQPCATLITM